MVIFMYAIFGSALITFLGLQSAQGYKGPSLIASFVYAVVVMIMILFLLRKEVRNLRGEITALFIGCLISPIVAYSGAFLASIVLFVLAAIAQIIGINFCVTGGCVNTMLTPLLMGASVAGGLSLLAPLYFFRTLIPMPKNFSLIWIIFCVIFPLVPAFFVDLKPFEGLLSENGAVRITDTVLLAKIFFPWQVGTLFLIGLYFSNISNNSIKSKRE